ncbi:MAG TPA: phospholipase D-like domain-containing protein [Bryobacteraceae bacterium]|nr:phospholipase D-like domain-containing protein [Bryobacteraceae bacterium]
MHTAFLVIAIIAIALQGLSFYQAFFKSNLPYNILEPPGFPLDSPQFCSLLNYLTEAKLLHGNRAEVLTDGPCFYEAELAAIAAAQRSINLEAYIFHRGEVSKRFVEALAERARAGVKVRLTLDYIGSFSTPRSYLKPLTDAGGFIHWYHPLRPDFVLQLNNRTHRELLIVDGAVAFIGGAGIADWWLRDGVKGRRWRDMMIRIEGPSVPALQAVFAQNWLRVAGEILTGEEYFQFPTASDATPALVVGSTPAAGATQARILFQLLISCARKCVYISTPYFLPDRSARRAIIRAVRERNVEVKILTPGDNNDQRLTRASSRELYGSLLKHGIQIYEYRPSMNHTKAMMVDDCWVVVGSTNFDYRSFSINDEVNLALLDPATTRRIAEDFHRDISQSNEITYEEWRKKGRFRLADRIFSLLERQE